MTEADAINLVKLKAQTDAYPCLDDGAVTELVQKHKFAEVWQASHAYKPGDKVQPTGKNGHFYKCVKAGTSGLTEPNWLTSTAVRVRDGGDSLSWEECAKDVDGNLFDTRSAIHEAWIIKTSKAVTEIDTKLDTNNFSRSQIYDHCYKEAQKYAPLDF